MLGGAASQMMSTNRGKCNVNIIIKKLTSPVVFAAFACASSDVYSHALLLHSPTNFQPSGGDARFFSRSDASSALQLPPIIVNALRFHACHSTTLEIKI